mmetsp:Transcript_5315/g.12178  ORF Transcript_5315/g.12178 Transcript_5315/m.12178 type:complete len:253 (-) Transcript_5315:579-1337(-)
MPPTLQSVWLSSIVVPGALTMPSFAMRNSQPGNALEASAYSRPPQTRSTEHCLTTSTTNRNAKSSCAVTSFSLPLRSPFSFFKMRSSRSSKSAIARTGAVSVTSSTEMPIFHPSTLKSFWSPRTMAYGPRLQIHRVLFLNICFATVSGLSISPSFASIATANLSASVVVTLRSASVSLRIAHIRRRAMLLLMGELRRMYRCVMIVDMLPQGRMSISRGFDDAKPSESAWWSMHPIIRPTSLASDGTICFGSL